jgi:hypothetical protein
MKSYPVNPGVAAIFPWLAPIAQRYETYKFRKLEFTYRTQTASTTTGIVILGVDLDAADPGPVQISQAYAMQNRVADAFWKDQTLRTDLTGDRLPSRYTRPGQFLGIGNRAVDIKTYDLGNLCVSWDGANVLNVDLGLIEVHYCIDLFTPQSENGVGGAWDNDIGLDATHLFGTVADLNPDPHAILPLYPTTSASALFSQQGEFLIVVEIFGTGLGVNLEFHESGPSGTLFDLLDATVNAASTRVMCVARCRAFCGSAIAPTITATTVGSIVWSWAPCGYQQLDVTADWI